MSIWKKLFNREPKTMRPQGIIVYDETGRGVKLPPNTCYNLSTNRLVHGEWDAYCPFSHQSITPQIVDNIYNSIPGCEIIPAPEQEEQTSHCEVDRSTLS